MRGSKSSVLKLLLAFTVIFSGVFTYFGVNAAENDVKTAASGNSSSVTSDSSKDSAKAKGKKQLTEEQKKAFEEKKSEFEAKKKTGLEKWNSLTEEQKNELYAITDEISSDKQKLIDKGAELGIIDKADADKLKEALKTRGENMKKDGKLPNFGQKGKGPHTRGKMCENQKEKSE